MLLAILSLTDQDHASNYNVKLPSNNHEKHIKTKRQCPPSFEGDQILASGNRKRRALTNTTTTFRKWLEEEGVCCVP